MQDIGRSKRAARSFSLDDVAIMPTRRTRGIETVDIDWRIDAITFDFPMLAAPMDSVMSPATAIAFGELGGLGVLNLEGLWTRYADPEPLLEELGDAGEAAKTSRLQEIYSEPIKAELITERLRQIRDAGVPVAGALSPQNAQEFAGVVEHAGLDFFVIRGTAVSAQHVSNSVEPLDLARFIYELDVPVIVRLAGTNEEEWDGKNYAGEILATGPYICEIITKGADGEARRYTALAIVGK